MIEFKSSCGHTIRARDEDAGKEVRCSYCGQEALVPSDNEDELDFLFSEVDSEAVASERKPSGRRRPSGGPFGKRRRRGEFNPLDTILKLVYAAVAISVVYFVTMRFIVPMLNEMGNNRSDSQPSEVADKGSGTKQGSSSNRKARHLAYGLEGFRDKRGIYVASVPVSATVYYMTEEDDNKTNKYGSNEHTFLADVANSKSQPAGQMIDGCTFEKNYVIQVVMRLNNKDLRPYLNYGYRDFRTSIEDEHSNKKERDALMASYFLPDGADDVFVEMTPDWYYLVREFRHVKARSDQLVAIHALFIPRILNLRQMLRFLPQDDSYKFDHDYVKGELVIYNVLNQQDQQDVIDALSRIGVIPYVWKDKSGNITEGKLFRIDVKTGDFPRPKPIKLNP